jgi:hypothetical protein
LKLRRNGHCWLAHTKHVRRYYSNSLRQSSRQSRFSNCEQQQQRQAQKYKIETMTRSAEDLTRDKHINLKVLVEYIKNDLFPKAKFVLGKEEWDVGGMIYKDYLKCCDGRIGLQTMTEVVRERYMERIWMRAQNKKLQKKALVQKRSAIYTIMQNKFAGNLQQLRGVVEK